MPRRPSITIIALLVTALLFFFFVFSPSSSSSNILQNRQPTAGELKSGQEKPAALLADAKNYDPIEALGKSGGPSQELITGAPIMEHLANETIKAELGRASWKLFHTILAQYPVKPTENERETLSSYIYLFSRVYPCGQCAEHFQKMLKKYPPQTSSREAASQWGCFVHNVVNERLKKPIFDCNEISDKYNCGCGPDDKKNKDASEDKDATPAKKEAAGTESVLGETKIDHAPNDKVRGG